MGRHSRKKPQEPTTDVGRAIVAKGGDNPSWDELSPEARASEFDASHEEPRAYAARNFPHSTGAENRQTYGVGNGQHRKS
jgi:hypothetical protein